MATERKSYPQVAFRAGGMLPRLVSRGEPISEVARRDLDRYYTMLDRALPTFEVAEALLIADALNGTLMDAGSAHLLWAEIDEAMRGSGLAEKWGVDAGLVVRLRQMTPFEQLAIADAAERAWTMVGRGDSRDMTDILRDVGLIP